MIKLINSSPLKITAIFFCIATTAFTLSLYAKLIQHLIAIKYNWQFELLMVIGMIVFQYFFVYKQTWENKLDYYFQMLLVSLIGSALLWPLLLANHFFKSNDIINLMYFFSIVGIMFFIHKKIVAKIQFPGICRTPGFCIALLF
jgi:hypothetical protein